MPRNTVKEPLIPKMKTELLVKDVTTMIRRPVGTRTVLKEEGIVNLEDSREIEMVEPKMGIST